MLTLKQCDPRIRFERYDASDDSGYQNLDLLSIKRDRPKAREESNRGPKNLVSH